LRQAATPGDPLADTQGLIGKILFFSLTKLGEENVNNEVGQTLTNIRVNSNAEAEAIFRDKLNARLT
jgi:hypothetical protein